MNNKRVYVIIGTRPEAIKMAPLVLELKARPALDVKVIATGQHRELARLALCDFGIQPDFDLQVMKAQQTLSSLTAAILGALEGLFAQHGKPDLVLCHGDTTSAFATAVSCLYHSVPLAHVEAGLRSHDLAAPFPEEINRRSIASLAAHHFAPTDRERSNLELEGVAPDHISVVGNTVADSLRLTLPAAPNTLSPDKTNIVVTLHRRENSGTSLRTILHKLRAIIEDNDELVIHFPVHPNPRVQEEALRILAGTPRISLLPPLHYPQFIGLLAKASLVITDSGGVQEEAAALDKATIIVRDRTERSDGLSAGNTVLVGSQDGERLEQAIQALLGSSQVRHPTIASLGGASVRISDIITSRLLA